MSERGSLPDRRPRPLRFVWQMDAELRFTASSAAFAALIGPAAAAMLGRPWPQIADALALDPQERIAQALASRGTWSDLPVIWPGEDGSAGLVVELSGLPVFDRDHAFVGFRGFGICRNAIVSANPAGTRTNQAPLAGGAENVVRLRPGSETDWPALSPGERNAFHELRRQLTERLMHTDRWHDDGRAWGRREAADPAPAGAAPAGAAPAGAAPAGARQPARRRAGGRPQRDQTDQRCWRSSAGRSANLSSASRLAPPRWDRSTTSPTESAPPTSRPRERLLALVGDLIDLSGIESGTFALERSEIALNLIAQECVAAVQLQASRKRIIVRTSLAPSLPHILADPHAIHRIVLKLMDNAIGNGAAGSQVIVSTTLAESGEVVLRVRDGGSCAPAPDEPAGSDETDLSLELARALAEANRASLSITPAPDAGTLAALTFQARRDPAA